MSIFIVFIFILAIDKHQCSSFLTRNTLHSPSFAHKHSQESSAFTFFSVSFEFLLNIIIVFIFFVKMYFFVINLSFYYYVNIA